MTAFFQFALSGFWTFCGVAFLIALMGEMLAKCIRAMSRDSAGDDDE